MINFFKWIFGKGEDEGSEMITLDEVLTTSQEFLLTSHLMTYANILRERWKAFFVKI